MKIQLFYVPFKDMKEAKKVSKELVKRKLCVCSNTFEIKSIYEWQLKIEEGFEVLCIFKTKISLKERLEKEIEKLHSYDVPAIINFEVNCNKSYFDYLESELKST